MPIAIEVTAEPIEVMAEPIEVTAGRTLDLQDQCERNPLCLRGFRSRLPLSQQRRQVQDNIPEGVRGM